jgi:hypothetical protein
MLFGLLATLGSPGIQAAMFFTIAFFVRVPKDACPLDADLNEQIYNNQSTIWWCYAIFHFLVAITMILNEFSYKSDSKHYYKILMIPLSITQIVLLCQTM